MRLGWWSAATIASSAIGLGCKLARQATQPLVQPVAPYQWILGRKPCLQRRIPCCHGFLKPIDRLKKSPPRLGVMALCTMEHSGRPVGSTSPMLVHCPTVATSNATMCDCKPMVATLSAMEPGGVLMVAVSNTMGEASIGHLLMVAACLLRCCLRSVATHWRRRFSTLRQMSASLHWPSLPKGERDVISIKGQALEPPCTWHAKCQRRKTFRTGGRVHLPLGPLARVTGIHLA
jgi:hypothetical protein